MQVILILNISVFELLVVQECWDYKLEKISKADVYRALYKYNYVLLQVKEFEWGPDST